MSQNDRVVWSEGMFLRPQHYQQYTRYLENYIEGRTVSLRSFPWGFAALQLDQKLLSMGKLAISEASGAFQDGTPFSMPTNDDSPAVLDIPEEVKNTIVYLCLPLRRAGAMELDHKGDPDSLARYAPQESETQDSTTIGGGSATIQLGTLRTCLKLESDHLDDYACLGVGRVVEYRADGTLLMDDSYIPPGLNIQASTVLFGFLKELDGLLNHRAEALAGRLTISDRGGAAEIQDFLLLQAVNRFLPLIRHFANTRQIHPESLYQLLISMAGEMLTFTSSDKRVPDFLLYDHDKQQQSFAPVFDALRQSLSMVIEQNAVAIPLQERKYGIRVGTLSDKSLLESANFVLAVAADLPTEDIRQRFPSQVKIGATEQIRQLVNVQLPGIRVRPIPVAPRQIPYHSGFVYFELERGGELWDHLKTSGGIALHIGGEYPGLKMELWAIRG